MPAERYIWDNFGYEEYTTVARARSRSAWMSGETMPLPAPRLEVPRDEQ
jgi:hypothetical protein